MAKTLLVSYNSINGIPRGRYERGNAIAYSAEWGSEHFSDLTMLAALSGQLALASRVIDEQERTAESVLSTLQNIMIHDLPHVDVVYIYVGLSAMKGSMVFVKELQQLGKTVKMVACDCDSDVKSQFARDLGLEVIWSGCGGEDKLGQIFAEYADR